MGLPVLFVLVRTCKTAPGSPVQVVLPLHNMQIIHADDKGARTGLKPKHLPIQKHTQLI